MCGIVGYIGKKNGMEIVVNGLKKLEYRGYDSWGIATLSNKKIKVHKQIGKIGGFNLEKELPNFNGQICIGHTRWATHGGVTAKNSHPHLSCNKEIAVVHNGIVENYQELRKKLEKLGHKFQSQTDTEVIAHLIEEEQKKIKSFPEAVRSSLNKIEGSYALGIINSKENVLVGARKASPLVVGLGGDSTYYLGSDVPAFLKETNQVIFLDESEMVIINPAEKEPVIVKNVESNKIVKSKVVKIDWSAEEAEKGGQPHFMIKEMLEQPTVIEKTTAIDQGELLSAAKMIKEANRIFVVACGTALHAGLYGAYLLAEKNNLLVQPISAGEFPYFGHLIRKGDLVITVSQSGETADVLESVRIAEKAGAKVLALVNVIGSSLMRLATNSLLTKAGSEICVLSTKAYVSQQAMFVMLSAAIDDQINRGIKTLKNIASDISKIIDKKGQAKIKKIARFLSKADNIYALGRGINYPNSLEACLKIKEVSYIHAEGFAGGDLKHGPIALIAPGVPVLVFITDDQAEKEIISNAMEVKARGAYIIGIGPENNQVFDEYLPVEKNGYLTPIASIVYPQLLAYYIALEKKLDPDKPRNLAKSVTVK